MGQRRWCSHRWLVLVLSGLAAAGAACSPGAPSGAETTTSPSSNPDDAAAPADAGADPGLADAAEAGCPDAGAAGEAGSSAASGGADAAAVARGDAVDPEPAVVTIADGELEGTQRPGHVRRFLGIPYAAPPVAELRFAAPQAVRPWQARRSATGFGPRCAQLAAPRWQTAASSAEDCLYLNVWSPAAAGAAPVLVVLHGSDGGSGAGGSASEPAGFGRAGWRYDGESLAREHGLVVVTLDYRLGVFGFLAHRELAAESWRLGNQGLWDQQLALGWVQRNIAAFGGDPGRVTLFGQAGGARDVCLHVASPESRGLFQRAIGHSAGCTIRQSTGDEAMRQAISFARQVGCDTADAISCLRSKSTDELLAATTEVASFGPVVDGQFLPRQPRELYAAGDIARLPYLMGSNSDEGTALMSGEPELYVDGDLKAAITREFTTPSARIAQRYPLSDFARAAKPYAAALARILGDANFVCPTVDTALLASQAGARVYLYNFDVALIVAGENLGATHGSELSYVFGDSAATTETDQKLRARIQAWWARFVATGDPNGEDPLEWPAFRADADRRIDLSVAPRVVDDFRADECAFWRSTYANAFATPEPAPL